MRRLSFVLCEVITMRISQDPEIFEGKSSGSGDICEKSSGSGDIYLNYLRIRRYASLKGVSVDCPDKTPLLLIFFIENFYKFDWKFFLNDSIDLISFLEHVKVFRELFQFIFYRILMNRKNFNHIWKSHADPAGCARLWIAYIQPL